MHSQSEISELPLVFSRLLSLQSAMRGDTMTKKTKLGGFVLLRNSTPLPCVSSPDN